MLRILTFLIIYLISNCADAANFQLRDGTFMELNGKIVPGDVQKLQQQLIQVQNYWKTEFSEPELKGFNLSLDSDGGSIEEAILIGRLVRKNHGQTVVAFKSKCLSACVLIQVSGVHRSAIGKIGIHRPYFYNLENGLSSGQIRQKLDVLNSEIKTYLTDMDIPITLLDAMKSVMPESMRILNKEEIEHYGINGSDAVEDERDISEEAYRYGTISSEFRKRKINSERVCGSFARAIGDALMAYLDCNGAQLYGLTLIEFKNRRASIQSMCPSLSGSNRNACIREVMTKRQ